MSLPLGGAKTVGAGGASGSLAIGFLFDLQPLLLLGVAFTSGPL